MPKIRRKHFIFFAGILIISVFGWYQNFVIRLRAQEEIKQELFQMVDIALAVTDPQKFSALSASSADNTNAEYLALRELYLRIQGTLKKNNIRWVYAMKVYSDGVIKFVIDSVPVTDVGHSEPGVVYVEPPHSVFSVYQNGRAEFTGPYEDEYGNYYSVFAPIRSESGSIIGVMGADVEVAAFNKLLRARTVLPLFRVILAGSLFAMVYLVWSSRDEARRIEEERAKERESLLLNIGEGVVAINAKGRVVFVNRFAASTVGVSPSVCLGKPVQDHWLLRNEKGEALPDAEQTFRASATAKNVTRIYYLQRVDGSLVPVTISLTTLVSRRDTRIILAFRDVTREVEADRLKSEFISIASHQLKSPITLLKWSIESLRDSAKGNTPLRKEIDGIRETVVHMNGLINSLLNVSRLESGRMNVDPQPTDLRTLVADVAKELKVKIRQKRQTLTVDVDPKLQNVSVDPHLVRELYKNLVSNAVKYTPNGGDIRVRIAIKGQEVVTSVSDNGVGIPAGEQARVFQKFFRGSNIISLPEHGTGLGLYLADQIVRLSGGEIWFKSSEGKGTTFWFTLPMAGSKRKKGPLTVS